jgi:hypothetical protein
VSITSSASTLVAALSSLTGRARRRLQVFYH